MEFGKGMEMERKYIMQSGQGNGNTNGCGILKVKLQAETKRKEDPWRNANKNRR